MPRQRTKKPSTGNKRISFLCPIEECLAKTKIFKSQSAWTKHKRTYHHDVDLSRYGSTTTMLTDTSGSLSPSNSISPLSSAPPSPSAVSISSLPHSDNSAANRDPTFNAPTVDDISQYDVPVGSLRVSSPPSCDESVESASERHPTINGSPCNKDGDLLLDPTLPPPAQDIRDPDDWTPFRDEIAFRAAELFFKDDQASAGKIDQFLDIWADSLAVHADVPPFSDHKDLYNVIDAIPSGGAPWQSFTFNYNGLQPEHDVPKWMTADYTVWYRDPHQLFLHMLENPDFAEHFDYAPLRQYDDSTGKRQYENFMSGDWAWKQADSLAENPENNGAMFVPIILGSDKTTVSIATGQNEYWPLYASIGNIHNNVRRAHGSGLVLVGFLAIPKADHVHSSTPNFRSFRRQLFHSSLSKIFDTLRPGMTVPEVVRCPDGHFRHAIWGFGPYIADYPEQTLLACIVQGWCARCRATPDDLDGEGSTRQRTKQITEILIKTSDVPTLWTHHGIVSDVIPFTNDFPRADIHELIAPDLLHQVIKGTFKDHLVTWVEEYLVLVHGKARANRILDDIDHRIAIVPPFTGLRRFPEGRRFKQWTGDDSKALMKVYLPALEGHLPVEIIRAFRAFLEFCYIARRHVLSEDDLDQLQESLAHFHQHRTIFKESGVRDDFSLPRQHSLMHYHSLIRLFGAPNGLCSSITESKHIRAVKEPWRRSNRNEAIGQMLVTNQRLDQLAAARVDFSNRGMLTGRHVPSLVKPNTYLTSSIGNSKPPVQTATLDEEPLEEAEINPNAQPGVRLALKPRYRWPISKAATKLDLPSFQLMVRRYLYDHFYPNSELPSNLLDDVAYPEFSGRVSIFYSATATFHSASDISGISGLHRENIHATPSWRNGQPRYDCAFIHPKTNTFKFNVARILTFFSFVHGGEQFQCALVHQFFCVADGPDEDTGLWIVEPGFTEGGGPQLEIIAIGNIYRAAHLVPVYQSSQYVARSLTMHDSLDTFKQFYINKFVDYHAFGITL